VFENRVLGRICRPKKEDITGGWRKFHDELHNLYSSQHISMIKSRRMKWVGQVVCMREINAYKNFISKLEG
jgi:hypothetical protein